MDYPKFNPKAPHGTSSPIENGCVFYQNGQHYDANYNCVDFQTGKILQRANPEPVKPVAKKTDKLAEQQAKLNAARNPRTTPEQEGEDEDVGGADDAGDGGGVGANADGGPSEVSEGIDLVKWAKGEAKGVMWLKVKAAMVAAGYASPENAAGARAAIAAKHGLTLS